MRNIKGQFIEGNVPDHKGYASFICLGCKQSTPCHPYELKWRKYCNLACKKKYRPKVKCPQCGKVKEVSPCLLKVKKTFYCSQKCKAAFQVGKPNKAIIGDKHPMKKLENKLKVRGKNHGHWGGELPNNRAGHKYITYHYGKAYRCINSPNHKGPYDWSNISYQYLRDINDWEQLCRRCHMKKDKAYREKMKIETTRFVFDKNGKRL